MMLCPIVLGARNAKAINEISSFQKMVREEGGELTHCQFAYKFRDIYYPETRDILTEALDRVSRAIYRTSFGTWVSYESATPEHVGEVLTVAMQIATGDAKAPSRNPLTVRREKGLLSRRAAR